MEKYRPQPNKYDLDRITDPEKAIKKAETFVEEKNNKEKIEFLLHQLGPRVTAASLGLRDARTLRQWQTEENIDDDSNKKINILSRFTYSFSSIFGPESTSGFLRSLNPYLNDSPLMVLRNERPEKAAKLLDGALKAFIY